MYNFHVISNFVSNLVIIPFIHMLREWQVFVFFKHPQLEKKTMATHTLFAWLGLYIKRITSKEWQVSKELRGSGP